VVVAAARTDAKTKTGTLKQYLLLVYKVIDGRSKRLPSTSTPNL